ncbi:MAG TPA: 23S rRNA (guanosine(2251)-2'-O)-methyltransferase RlmB [Anaerolineae bacterium]|nr:23S rRNA (guanosine(2251)-2'-O)-methyltransferase RlmB [Anaerolineae bacterium]
MREILFGRQPVRETLRAGRRKVFKLLLAQGVKPHGIVGQILTLAERARVPVQAVDRRELDKLGGEVNHQGLAAEVSGYPYADLTTLLESIKQTGESPFLLLLDHVRDPQNLGSLLRTCEAVGIHGVVIPGRRAASVTPAAVRASAGAAEHVRVAQVTNLVQAMERLKVEGIWLAGLEATPSARLYTQADLSGSLALVVGSEDQGLARLVRERCDFLIRLPMHGQVESLNAAIAASIALYEAHRQRAPDQQN